VLLSAICALLVAAPAHAAKPSRIVFTLRYGIGIVTFGAPASERVIEADTATRIPRTPVLSPNGDDVAYGVYDPTHQTSVLTVRDRHNRIIESLPITLRGGFSVAWSPDGHELAYTCSDGAIYSVTDSFSGSQIPTDNLCVMNLLTGTSRVIATSTAAASLTGNPRLSWAPDGTILASGRAASCNGCSHELAAAESGHGQPLQPFLTNGSEYAQFSPKGDRIVFQDDKGIAVANANGGDVERIDAPALTDCSACRFAGPAWSPDAKSLVMSAKGDNGNLDLFEVPLNGDKPKQLTTTTPGDDETFASWGPPLSTCSVPNVKGKKLTQARRLVALAGCTIGKVRGPKKTKKVVKQSPRAGREVDPGTKVDLTFG
jgi:WD40 repeat protein